MPAAAEPSSRLGWLRGRSSGLRRLVARTAVERVTALARWISDAPEGPAAQPWEPPRRGVPEGGSGVVREEYVRRTFYPEAAAPDGEPPSGAPLLVDPAPGPSRDILHLTEKVERRLRQLTELRDFARAEDPVEAVHDLRVASRRLRAFLETFGPFLDTDVVRSGTRPLRRVTRAVGALREWDVHAQNLSARRDACDNDAERAALEHLLDRIDARRRKERKRARRKLRRADLTPVAPLMRRALDELATRAASPSTTFDVLAWLALEPAVDRVVRATPPADGQEHADQMHRMRIAVKRLRYVVELIEPALGPSFPSLHAAARDLQTLLGDHHDRVVLAEMVERRRARLRADGRNVLAGGMDAVLAALTRERGELFERFGATGFLDGPSFKRKARSALVAGSGR